MANPPEPPVVTLRNFSTGKDRPLTREQAEKELFRTALYLTRQPNRIRGHLSEVRRAMIDVTNAWIEEYRYWQHQTGNTERPVPKTTSWSDPYWYCWQIPFMDETDRLRDQLTEILSGHITPDGFPNFIPDDPIIPWNQGWGGKVRKEILALAREYGVEPEEAAV